MTIAGLELEGRPRADREWDPTDKGYTKFRCGSIHPLPYDRCRFRPLQN